MNMSWLVKWTPENWKILCKFHYDFISCHFTVKGKDNIRV